MQELKLFSKERTTCVKIVLSHKKEFLLEKFQLSGGPQPKRTRVILNHKRCHQKKSSGCGYERGNEAFKYEEKFVPSA